MVINPKSYSLFYRFIQTYSPNGFKNIDPANPLMIELEELMANNNQFFFVGDVIKVKIFFTSKGSSQIIGIDPAEISPYHFFEATHPDDIERHSLARSKLFNLGQQLFIAKNGYALLSTNLKVRNASQGYTNLNFQCYLFYSAEPDKTVYEIQIHTNVDWFNKITTRNHYYVGNDLSYFRYPDEELLMIGNPLTNREFEIVKLIESGLSSEQIAEKIFLSVHTINTHRSNILSKTSFNTTAELIFDFQKRGLM